MSRTLATVLSGLLLSSCAPSTWFGINTPSAPSPAAIRGDYDEIVSSFKNDDGSILVSAQEYTVLGYENIDEECDRFFDSLILLQRQLDLVQGQVTILSGATAAILLAAEASATAIGLTALGYSVANASIDNYKRYALLAPYAHTARVLIDDAQVTFIANAPVPESGEVVLAAKLVQDYARLCSVGQIIAFVNQAIEAAQAAVKEEDREILRAEDRLALQFLPELSFLSEEKLARLTFYLTDGLTNEVALDGFRTEFGAIAERFITETSRLTSEGSRIAAILASVRDRNPRFRTAISHVARSFGEEPAPARPAAAVPFAPDESAPDATKLRSIPTIVIR